MQELWVQGHFPLLLPYTRGQAESQASVELLKARGDQGTVSPQSTTSFSMSMPPSTFPPLLPDLMAAAPLSRCAHRNTPGNITFAHFLSCIQTVGTLVFFLTVLCTAPGCHWKTFPFFFSFLFYEILFQFSFFVSLQFNTADLLHLYECNLIRFDWKCWQHSQLSPQLSSHFN